MYRYIPRSAGRGFLVSSSDDIIYGAADEAESITGVVTTYDFFPSYAVVGYLMSTNIVGMGSTCHSKSSLSRSARPRWQAVELGIQAPLDVLIALAVSLSFEELLWN